MPVNSTQHNDASLFPIVQQHSAIPMPATVVAGMGIAERHRRRPTATLTVLSIILTPREVIGRAINHAPNSLVEADERQTLDSA